MPRTPIPLADDPFIKHLQTLVGKRVTGLAATPFDPHFGDPTTGRCYGLEFDDGTTAWIMCDPEGNGPGFLDLDPAAQPHPR